MLQDIAIEEFGHLEMVGKLIEGHTNVDQTEAYKSSLFAVRGRGHFLDSQAWTATYQRRWRCGTWPVS